MLTVYLCMILKYTCKLDYKWKTYKNKYAHIHTQECNFYTVCEKIFYIYNSVRFCEMYKYENDSYTVNIYCATTCLLEIRRTKQIIKSFVKKKKKIIKSLFTTTCMMD